MTFWVLFLTFCGFRIGFPPFPPEALDPQWSYHYRGATVGAIAGVLMGLLMHKVFGNKKPK